MADHTDIATLERILRDCRRVAVVGVSADWNRPSHFVAKYLVEHGYTMIPVNPAYAEVLGRRCHPTLQAAREAEGPIDLVDCFRRADHIGPIVAEAVAIGARVVWMQLGIVNDEAAAQARAAGLDVVMDRCIKIEHARLFGGLGWAGVNTGIVSSRRPRQLPY
ncbi:MAG TPA: CoA-binding protein [Burkholderiaceae bacterium]|nr:CoA-binding protein [Burkholderiaceae bacterium]